MRMLKDIAFAVIEGKFHFDRSCHTFLRIDVFQNTVLLLSRKLIKQLLGAGLSAVRKIKFLFNFPILSKKKKILVIVTLLICLASILLYFYFSGIMVLCFMPLLSLLSPILPGNSCIYKYRLLKVDNSLMKTQLLHLQVRLFSLCLASHGVTRQSNCNMAFKTFTCPLICYRHNV